MNIVKKSYYKLGAAMTTGFVLSMVDSTEAFAKGSNNLTKISDNIGLSIAGLPGMIAGIAYLIGLLLGVLGILKIKDHVENPTQTPLKDGAVRIAAGGALFALPIVMESMLGTIGDGGSAVEPAKLKAVSFSVLGSS